MGAATTLRTVRRSYEAVAPENQVLPEPWIAKLIIGEYSVDDLCNYKTYILWSRLG